MSETRLLNCSQDFDNPVKKFAFLSEERKIHSKEKISIICVGENHEDPTATWATLSAIKQFYEKNIPVIFCTEQPSGEKLMEYYKYLIFRIEAYDKMTKKFGWEGFYTDSKGELLPYFNKENREKIENDLKMLIKSYLLVYACKLTEDELIRDLLYDLVKLSVLRAEKDLLDYCDKSKTNYVSIDMEKIERDQFIKLIQEKESKDDKLYVIHQHEQKRIDIMTHNIYQHAIQPLEITGGVVICKTGLLHAHRLAANLYRKFSINTEAIYCYSDYSTENFSDAVELMHSSKIEVDSADIQEMYTKIPFTALHFNYKVYNQLLVNPKFNEIITASIVYQKISKPHILPRIARATIESSVCGYRFFAIKTSNGFNTMRYVDPEDIIEVSSVIREEERQRKTWCCCSIL